MNSASSTAHEALRSLMLVQDTRELGESLGIVCSGPGRPVLLKHGDHAAAGVVALRPDLSTGSYRIVPDREVAGALASDEVFGFDPFSSHVPNLRRLQHYQMAVLKSAKADELRGSLLVPAVQALALSRCSFDFDRADWDPVLRTAFADPADAQHEFVFADLSPGPGLLLVNLAALVGDQAGRRTGRLVLPTGTSLQPLQNLTLQLAIHGRGGRETNIRAVPLGSCRLTEA